MLDDSPHQTAIQHAYIGTTGGHGFALYHPAVGPTSDHALLICPSFGTEDVNAHRTLRLLAETTARAGIATLRLDYPGCGNADGDADTPDLFQAWQDSIVDAVAALRTLSGARHISLLGLRLGALLASLAAPRCGALHDLIAVAPVVSGRAYVREMKALHLAGLTGQAIPPSEGPAVFESGGFVMAEATHQALSAVDLLKLDAPPAQRVLVFERDDLPGPATKWAARLTELGADVVLQTLNGYATMMADPHRCTPPAAMMQAVLQHLQAPASAQAAVPLKNAPPDIRAALPLKNAQGQAVAREEAVLIGKQPWLLAHLSRPDDTIDAGAKHVPHSGLGILMLNAGATRSIGPNRLYVQLARHWATQGHLALRLDIAGIGDSPPHPDKPDNTVYSDTALQDVAQALAWLRQQTGVEKIVLMGLCSGAYHALKSVVNDQPADAAIMINPLTFFWKEGMSLEPGTVTDANVAQDMMRHRQSMWQWQTWMKLLRGGISVQRLVQIARQTLAWVGGKLYRNMARRLGVRMTDDLGQELMHAARRKVPLHFIFSDTDPGLPMLRAQGGPVVQALERQGLLSIRTISHADHTFTLAAPRHELAHILKETVDQLQRAPRTWGGSPK